MAKDRVHKTAIILSAVDKMTRVINRAFGKAERKLTSFQKKADKIAKSSAKVGKSAAKIGLMVAAPLLIATQKAVAFEESMADIAKVLNLQQGSKELGLMATKSQELAIHLGKTPREAAELIAALSQGGTAKKELFEIGKFTGEMSVAFEVMGERAGSAFTKTKNALGATTAETIKAMDAINHLSDNSAAKASQILDFMASGGASAAAMLKVTGQESASLGAFFISMGKSGSEAATIVSRLTKGLQKNNKVGKLFRSSGGGVEGIKKVLEFGNTLSGTQRFEFFKAFGEYGSDIALAATNLKGLNKVTNLVADSSKFANSVSKEFANRSNTRAFEMRKIQAQLEVIGIKMGNALLPVISSLAKSLTPILDKIAKWIERNPELTAQIVKGTAIFVAATLAISAMAFAVSGVTTAMGYLSAGMLAFSRAGRIATLFIAKPTLLLRKLTGVLGIVSRAVLFLGKAFRAAGVMMMANPIVAIVMAIAAAIYLIYRNWDTLGPYFKAAWNKVKIIFSNVINWFKGIGGRFFTAGKNIINSIANGIKAGAQKAVAAIKGVVTKVRSYLPFSPAKNGPLKDIHRIKLVETIATAIKPNAAISAMKRTVGTIANYSLNNSISPLSNATGGGITLNFNPTINIGGGGANGDVRAQLNEGLNSFKEELLRMVEEAQERKNRRKFS